MGKYTWRLPCPSASVQRVWLKQVGGDIEGGNESWILLIWECIKKINSAHLRMEQHVPDYSLHMPGLLWMIFLKGAIKASSPRACVRVHMITCKSTFAVGGHRSESCSWRSWRASLVSFLCDIFCTKTSGRTLILLNKPFYFRGY